jgi:hypothetical protein
MNAAKVLLLVAAAAALPSCAAVRTLQQGDGIARVNPASLAATPAKWDGREVEIVGLLVWDGENRSLHQSYGTYCRAAEKAGIYVDWTGWAGVSAGDNRRQVVVRGVFRNISAGAPGPGLLEPGAVVRWLSLPMKPCPLTRP